MSKINLKIRIVETLYAASLLSCLLLVLLFSSCNGELLNRKNPVAEVGGQYLYEKDIENIFFAGMSKEDSTAAIENYIRMWATDILMYEKAQENIENEDQIATLLENYRQSLLTYEYQSQLVKDRVNNTVSQEEISAYYNKNAHLFRLEGTVFKGLFLKVSNQAPYMSELRESLNNKNKDLDEIDKLSIKNAAKVEYFNEKWETLSEIKRKSPIYIENKESLKYRSFFESQDSLFSYFLYIQEYILEGEPQPLDYAEGKIRGILLEQRKNNFLKQFSNKLYEEAVEKGKVKTYQKVDE